MRQAIQELVRKGMLVRKRGVGTQVVQGHSGADITRPVALSSLYDDLARTGRTPRTDVLAHALEPADRAGRGRPRHPRGQPTSSGSSGCAGPATSRWP